VIKLTPKKFCSAIAKEEGFITFTPGGTTVSALRQVPIIDIQEKQIAQGTLVFNKIDFNKSESN